MDVRFSERPDGQIDASLGPDWPVFNEALSDSVSSLPPRGAEGAGLSTYWIDVAADGARRAAEHGVEQPFVAGNVTYLRVVGDRVVAGNDFDPDEAEAQSSRWPTFLTSWPSGDNAFWRSGVQRSALPGDIPAEPLGDGSATRHRVAPAAG